MVVLIACEHAPTSSALAAHLETLGHETLRTATVAELENVSAALEHLHVLAFSVAFSEGQGREIRSRLRSRFPQILTVQITDDAGHAVAPDQVSGWLADLHFIPADDGEPALLTLGDYELREKRRSTATTDIFRAWQKTMNREVILERLQPALRHSRKAARAFRNMVVARASVNYPSIAAVYETQETPDGTLFYTRELMPGRSLADIAHSAIPVSPERALHVLRAAGEAVTWMAERGTNRETLTAHTIYPGNNVTPRIANLAIPEPMILDEQEEICRAADCLVKVTSMDQPGGRDAAHVLGLIKATGPHALTTWKMVAREARAALTRIHEARTATNEEEWNGVRLGNRSKKGRTILISLGTIAIALLSWYHFQNKKSLLPRNHAGMIQIPAGEFIWRDGQKRTLGEFWIDSCEVSVAEYAGFLTALKSGDIQRYDHPDQPTQKKGHAPQDWEALHAAAKKGGLWLGYRTTLNSPVFNVDWWDAAAYATWKGARLPTGEEWEKAARGTQGNIYPWGSNPDTARANTGSDFSENPTAGGKIDGYPWWCDVDAMPKDISSTGVKGMAGNVAEWTMTWSPDPNLPDDLRPVYRGGHFRLAESVPCAKSWLAKDAFSSHVFLGFRTVRSTAPEQNPLEE